MFRKTVLTAIAAILMLASFQPAHAQRPEIPETMRAKQLPRQHLSGPRFGFTTFTGDVADQRNSIGKEAIMSQFGWQFETQIVSNVRRKSGPDGMGLPRRGRGAGRAELVPLPG